VTDESARVAAYPRWGFIDVFVGAAGFILLSALVNQLSRLPAVLAQPQLQYAIDQVLAGWLPLIAVVVIASRWRGRRSLGVDFGLRFRLLDIAVGVLAGVLLRFAAVGISEAVRVATNGPPVPYTGTVGPDPAWFVLTAIVAASLITPVIEELFFRGLVQRAIHNAVIGGPDRVRARDYDPDAAPAVSPRRRRVAGVVAVLGSALVFVLYHLGAAPDSPAAVSRLVELLVVGIVLGLLALFTGRLGPSIIAHAMFNLSVALLAILSGS
jgi:membrane protease YdiL (CAAX protease family)